VRTLSSPVRAFSVPRIRWRPYPHCAPRPRRIRTEHARRFRGRLVGCLPKAHASMERMTDARSRTKPEVEFIEGEAPEQLVGTDLIVGDGPEAQPGATVEVRYVGVDIESGEDFDSSWSRGETITFPLSGLIKGWQD